MSLKIFNIGRANGLLDNAAAVLAPALAKSGITTVSVEGKTVPVAEAPLASQIAALLTAQPATDGAQNAAEALVSNELISKELEVNKSELALKTTAVDSLTRDNKELTSKLSNAEATVQDLTVKNTVLKQERDACSNQFASANQQLAAQRTELAKLCIASGCVETKGDTDDAKLESVKEVSHADLLKSYRGAVNAAIAKTGALPLEIPIAPPGAASKQEPKGRARMLASIKIAGQ